MLYPTVVLAVTVLISLMLWDAVSFGEKLIYRSSNFILLTSASVSAGLSFSSFFIDEFVSHRNLFLITGYRLLIIAVAVFILLLREKTYSDKIATKMER